MGRHSLTNIGDIYGTYKVIERDKEKSGHFAYFKCKCLYCGKEINKRGTDLRKGNSIICKCQQKLDIIGKIYGDVKVIRKTEKHSIDKCIIYECQCIKCGALQDFASNRLKRDEIHCQICYKPKTTLIDITGQQFNLLKVLYRDDSKPKGHFNDVYWICECQNCGAITSIRGYWLRNGAYSCGCIKSKGEYSIAKLLKENNINFKKEYTFDDLKDINKLRFDFAILDKNNKLLYLIEYDGIQHFESRSGGWNTLKNVYETQRRDKIKNDYCKKHNIPLIRIKYDEDITLDKILLKEIL